MESIRFPRWEDLKRDYLDTGLPHRLVVRSAPAIIAFTDAGAARLGVRFELMGNAGSSKPSILEAIAVDEVADAGKRYLEISSKSPLLYESFYRLVGQISNAVLEGAAPHNALQDSLALWEALLAQASILSDERQSGLFGELVFLERLLQAGVGDAVSTWVGPDKQAHDFRWKDKEFEVKTTTAGVRIHTINGIGQLSPSFGCGLFLVSLQTTDAGSGGRSLPELVDHLRTAVGSAQLKSFEGRLQASGYLDRDSARYGRRRKLRRPMMIIPVQDGVPRLVDDAMASIPDRFVPARIRGVTYDIDVTGLGHPDGSPEFLAIVPKAGDVEA